MYECSEKQVTKPLFDVFHVACFKIILKIPFQASSSFWRLILSPSHHFVLTRLILPLYRFITQVGCQQVFSLPRSSCKSHEHINRGPVSICICPHGNVLFQKCVFTVFYFFIVWTDFAECPWMDKSCLGRKMYKK